MGKRFSSRAELRSVVFDFAHGMCEWPACSERATELAHIVSSGMGGDPEHSRDTVDNVFAACPTHARVSDGLPPPSGSYADRDAEYAKVPGQPEDHVYGWQQGTYGPQKTSTVMSSFAKWLWLTRAQRKLRGNGG